MLGRNRGLLLYMLMGSISAGTLNIHGLHADDTVEDTYQESAKDDGEGGVEIGRAHV